MWRGEVERFPIVDGPMPWPRSAVAVIATSLLVALCGVCASVSIPAMERRLRREAIAHLEEDGFAASRFTVEFDGRDATVRGPLPPGRTAANIRDSVMDWGVRSVDVEAPDGNG